MSHRCYVASVLPVVVRVSTSQGAANLRSDPSTNANIVGVLPRGTLLIVQSALPDRTWYYVTLPEDGAEAWIYNTLIATVNGDLDSVPASP